MTTLIHDCDGALVPENIAITCRFDPIGRVHFRSGKLTSRSASRFGKLQAAFLKGRLGASPVIQVALSLVLFDGIASETDLSRALADLEQIYRWDNQVRLEWKDPIGRQNRRHLSLITQAILASPRIAPIDASATIQALDAFLCDIVRSPNRSYSLKLLLLDAEAWLYEHLPLPLFAHCIGKAPIAALPKSTLARHESRLALSLLLDPEIEKSNSRAFASAIGSFFAKRRNDHGGWFIDELVSICRRKRALSNGDDKRRMLHECEALASRDIEIAPLGGLILAWAIDLLQSGTRTKIQLKAITPAKYIGIAAKRLWQAFREEDLEEFGTEDFLNVYLSMMNGLSNSQKRTLASALSSWHFFLMCWFEVAPLYHSLHKWVPPTAPKANLVWKHEIEMIRAWLQAPMPDARHHAQLQVAFEIASQIRIRATELLNLRLQNFHWTQESLTIEVATKATDGGVKTLAAFRRHDAQSAECVALIKAWYMRRQQEGAFPTDYLFGDPHRPDTKYAPGQLYTDLNRLLKAATGDPTIALHALSHTKISMDWHKAAMEKPGADINTFERESVDAGHASAATGFANYFHLFESWLRCCLNQEIEQHFETWPCVRPWVGKTPEAFRQALCRARRKEPSVTAAAFATCLIETARPALLLPGARDGIVLQQARNPIAPTTQRPLTLSAILDILNDIAFGHSAEAIALRSNRSDTEINQLGRVAIELLQNIGEVDRRDVRPQAQRAVVDLQTYLRSGILKHIQFQRVGQAKVAPLYDLIASGRQAEIVTRGINAWVRCYQRGYVSLHSLSSAFPFVEMLDAADYPRSAIIIRGIDTTKRTLISTFHTGKPGLPLWESIQPRPGRPKAYLILASHTSERANGQPIGNAGVGMGGIHGLMFAASVRRQMHHITVESKN